MSLMLENRFPDFYIIGTPKCGTTSLAEMLARNKRLFVPSVKEPHFFARDLAGPHTYYLRNKKTYLDLYREAGDRPAGDCSVWYYRSVTAAKEIYEINPQAKIILMVRRPADLIRSLYFHKLYSGDEREFNINKAVFGGSRISNTPSWTSWGLDYLDVPKWAEYMPRWERYFSGRILVIKLDDFAADPLESYDEVCNFLGVQGGCNDVLNYSAQNRSKAGRSLAIQSIMNNMPYGAKVGARKLVGVRAANVLREAVSAFSRRKVHNNIFSEDSISVLNRSFFEDIKYLENEYGLDLSDW